MSDASQGRDVARIPRFLRQEERAVVLALLKHSPSFGLLSRTLDTAVVADMNDGGMGSIKFIHPDDRDRRFGFEVAKATYTDEDGVLVSIALNLDQRGDLFELDFWKVDFSSLGRYPRAEELTIIPRASG